jgi:hypothetical protein
VLKRSSTTVTFVLPADVGPVSVVGDFNGWDPMSTPLRKRSNGTRSAAVELTPGDHQFRYLAESTGFFDDPDADRIEPNGYGDTHSVLSVS